MTVDPFPEWFYPGPQGGWTADDMDRLPPDAPRMELIDGALVVRHPQTSFHSQVMRQLANAIEDAVPPHLLVSIRMTITLDRRQRPEPDIVVTDAPQEPQRTSYLPEEVLLAVEIVDEDTEERDRHTKPLKYAAAGIRHFWRVEKENSAPVVYVFELDDTTGTYVPTGIHREKLDVPTPFPMGIDLTTLHPGRRPQL
jgi:Uma2 family endonuclease